MFLKFPYPVLSSDLTLLKKPRVIIAVSPDCFDGAVGGPQRVYIHPGSLVIDCIPPDSLTPDAPTHAVMDDGTDGRTGARSEGGTHG